METYDLEASTVTVVEPAVREILAAVRNLWQMIEQSRSFPERKSFLALMNDERMRHASQLNADICQDLEAGLIRTDQEALSTYVLVLNRTIERIDQIFLGRKAKD